MSHSDRRILPLPLQPAATLFYINAGDAGQPLNVHLERILVIGSSPLALAAVELFASRRLHSFPNLLLITEDSLEAEFSPNVVNLAPPAWGQMEMGRRKRLSLQSVVNIVVGRVTSIDRDSQTVTVNEGSSFGVLIVRKGANGPPQELLSESWHYGDYLMAEEFIPGRELTVAVLGDRPLAVTEITTLRDYYDFDAKYSAGGSRHVIPADVPEHITAMAMDFALRAHQVLGCRGATRSDFRYDDKRDRLVILETNTQPGMTPTSLVPEQAAFVGMSFEDLVAWMIEDASCRR